MTLTFEKAHLLERDEALMRRALEALPDHRQLELLADWFDMDDEKRGRPAEHREVQVTLRRWAMLSRDANAALNERLSGRVRRSVDVTEDNK